MIIIVTSVSQELIRLLRLRFSENKKLSLILEVAEIHMKQEVYLMRPFVYFPLIFVGVLLLLCIDTRLFFCGLSVAVMVALSSFRYTFIIANQYRVLLDKREGYKNSKRDLYGLFEPGGIIWFRWQLVWPLPVSDLLYVGSLT